MLVWSLSGRALVWSVAALLIGVFYLAPLAVIVVASFSQHWNGVLPSGFTFEHYAAATGGDMRDAVYASIVTGFVASLLALVTGAWAALALRAQVGGWSQPLGLLFFIPSAVPSVSVGLGLLVAFSQRPLLLNGTTAIVIIAHYVLISAFAFGNVSAGLSRLTPDYEEVASCLGARPAYRLIACDPAAGSALSARRVRPQLRAFDGRTRRHRDGLSPGWVTMPVAIFGLTDRGDIFSGAALTMILVAVTLALLIGLERAPFRSAAAR